MKSEIIQLALGFPLVERLLDQRIKLLKGKHLIRYDPWSAVQTFQLSLCGRVCNFFNFDLHVDIPERLQRSEIVERAGVLRKNSQAGFSLIISCVRHKRLS